MRVDAKCVSLEDLFDEAEEKYERVIEAMMPNNTVDSYDMIVACMVGNMIAKAFEKKKHPKSGRWGKQPWKSSCLRTKKSAGRAATQIRRKSN